MRMSIWDFDDVVTGFSPGFLGLLPCFALAYRHLFLACSLG